jgi:CDP-4-dehydro-6-deoxyglucose reductase
MSFEVRLKPSGRSFSVEPSESILTKALRCGVHLPYGCRMGTCCSCRGKVVSGEVDLGNAHPAYLRQEQRDQGYALLCQAHARSDVEIEIEELPALATPQIVPAIVKATRSLCHDVMLLHLRLPLHVNMRFCAGQYVDLLLPGGARRSYSIANPPQIGGVIDLEFHIRHLPRGLFTDRLFARPLQAREKFQFEGPLGTFYLRDSIKPAILLASGTGYAPIRSILLDALPKHDGRPMKLYWGGRRPMDIYAMDEAQKLAGAYPNLEFVPVVSGALPEDEWTGRTGLVHAAVMQDHPDLSQWQIYACGAPIMVDAARTDFIKRCKLPDSEFFADSFVSEADVARSTL